MSNNDENLPLTSCPDPRDVPLVYECTLQRAKESKKVEVVLDIVGEEVDEQCPSISDYESNDEGEDDALGSRRAHSAWSPLLGGLHGAMHQYLRQLSAAGPGNFVRKGSQGGDFIPKCPVCRVRRTRYHCQDCIATGDFIHSGSTYMYELYSEKQLRLFSLRRDVADAKADAKEMIRERARRIRILDQIHVIQKRISNFRRTLDYNRKLQAVKQQSLAKISTANNNRRDRIQNFVNKICKGRKYVDNYVAEVNKMHGKLGPIIDELTKIRGKFLTSLDEIFKLEEVHPVSVSDSDLMLDFLSEAMKTSYVHGRISVEQSREMQYRLVSSLLSSSGNYTPLYALIATSKTESPAGVDPLPAFNISAGLSLAAQLTQVISEILSVPIPIRLSYGDFGVIDTSAFRFSKKVVKLNMMVIHLALVVGVDRSEIRPCQTVHNIKLIIDHVVRKAKRLSRPRLQHKATTPDPPLTVASTTLNLAAGESSVYVLNTVESAGNQVCEWEKEILNECDDMRMLDPSESDSDEDGDSQQEQEWETLTTDIHELPESLSSSPSDRIMERPTSSGLSFMSSFFWGTPSSPSSPRK